MVSTITDLVLSPFRTMGKAGRILALMGMLNGCSAFFSDFKVVPADGGVDHKEQEGGRDNDGFDAYDGHDGSDIYDAGDAYDGPDVRDAGRDGNDVYDAVREILGDALDATDGGGDVYDAGDAADGGCVGLPPMTACGLNRRGVTEYVCRGDVYVPVGCNDPDECVDGSRMSVACGLNDRGTQSNICVEGHYFEGACTDPDVCVDGAVERAACGLNGRGTQSRSCVEGHYTAFGSCVDPDECVDGTREDVSCGLNNRGSLERVCETGRYVRSPCADPDVCVDGAVERAACGLNGRGTQSRSCAEGQYTPFGACTDPDECVDGTRENVACGLNSRGSLEQVCVDGHYSRGPCVDPDECRDGSVDMAACGLNGNGVQQRTCVDGRYEMFDPCNDPDECVSGAMDRVSCGVDVGECFLGLESRLCAADGGGIFIWQRQGDCDGRNPPQMGERGYREDMNGDMVCSVPDLNGLDDDCNGIVDDGYCMVVVPEGFFGMGCNSLNRADCQSDNVPQHNIVLSLYSIDKHEVTNDQYRACVTAGSCLPPSSPGSFSRPSYYDNPAFGGYPVIWVNYAQAVAFCDWSGKRLPTEAEWEKAARGTDDRRYPWGEAAPTCELANFGFRLCHDPPDTTEVGSLPMGASPYGALDMAGNVIEWVHDWYDQFYYGGSPLMDPQGPAMGTQRVQRGGYFANNATFITVYVRSSLTPETAQSYLGFRCVKNER